ncbi:MAG: mechanosensitive ion channel protein MscS, partial [Azonexus sp.]
MNNPELQILLQLNQLRVDVQRSDFIWQALALALCLGLAWFLARRWIVWRGAQPDQAPHSRQIRDCLTFPLFATVLVGLAGALLKPFMAVSLLGVAFPLLLALALVRAVVSTLRHSFSYASLLNHGERLIRILFWQLVALYLTALAPHLISAFEGVEFRLFKLEFYLCMILLAIVTILFTVVAALWISN